MGGLLSGGGPAAGGFFPQVVGKRTRHAAAGGPGPHRVGGPGEGTTLREALPRGLGLSLEKAQTKEHQGAAAPWTPGEGEGPRWRSSGFGFVTEGAVVVLYLTGD